MMTNELLMGGLSKLMKIEPIGGLTKFVKNELMGGPAELWSNRCSWTVMAPNVVDATWLKSLPPLKYECANVMCVKDACGRWIALLETEEGAAPMVVEESIALVASMVASVASMVASMASNGGFDGFDGVDGVDGGFDGFDGVDGWRRWLRWLASMVVTGVFDTEGTDVEVPLCPQ